MPDNQLRGALDAIRSRLQAELDAQLNAIAAQHEEALAAARGEAEAEAEQRWASRVEAVRAEWTSRLDSEVTAARSEAERRMVAESMRLRVEAEQAAAESTARVREELEHALADERERSHAEIEAERTRTEHELEAERQRLSAAGDRTQSAVVEAHATERQAQLAAVERLLGSVRAIGGAGSLSAALGILTQSAAAEARRVALFIVNGSELQLLTQRGFDGALAPSTRLGAGEPLIQEALRGGETVSTVSGDQTAPAFASLAPDRAAIAVPIVVGGHTVAVLYADDGGGAEPDAPAAWPEAVQILARHTSACLAWLTAVRTGEALAFGSRRANEPTQNADTENGARRYARLLVSEIKLYNEAAVRLGRQNRDLMSRLRPEIERAQRLYEERVSPAVSARGAYFQQELVQTLADGDSSLLGA